MTRAITLCALVLAAAASLVSCGGGSPAKGHVPPYSPVESPGCSPVSYGGPGRPDLLIGASTALQGQFGLAGIQVGQAMKLVLAQRGWRAGEYSVGLQICDEVSAASSDASSPTKCRRIARAFARSSSVIAVHGPLSSACAQEAIPILNRAPGGPVPQTLAGATYVGFTRSGPGVEPDEPARYFPTGHRSVVRLTPPDDVQGAAGALLALSQGARRAYALNHGKSYGYGLAEAFRVGAVRAGLQVVGTDEWDPAAPNYRQLAQRIRNTGADAVYLGGYTLDNGPQLIRDIRRALGAGATILGPDAFSQTTTIVEGAGVAAEGFAWTIAVLPTAALPPAGRRFASEFEQRFGSRPCCYTVHTAQATELMLDAIAESDGTRAQVLEKLFAARVDHGYLGDFTIDRNGDATLTTIGAYEIEDGRRRFTSTYSPPPELFASQ